MIYNNINNCMYNTKIYKYVQYIYNIYVNDIIVYHTSYHIIDVP